MGSTETVHGVWVFCSGALSDRAGMDSGDCGVICDGSRKGTYAMRQIDLWGLRLIVLVAG